MQGFAGGAKLPQTEAGLKPKADLMPRSRKYQTTLLAVEPANATARFLVGGGAMPACGARPFR